MRRRPALPETRPRVVGGSIEVLNVRVRVDGAESDDDGDWVHRPLDVGRDDARAPSTDDGREYGVDGLGIVPGARRAGNGAGDASEVEILHMTERAADAAHVLSLIHI